MRFYFGKIFNGGYLKFKEELETFLGGKILSVQIIKNTSD